MKRRLIMGALMGSVLFFGLAFSVSAQTSYGSQLMTPQERAEHRAKMRSLPPAEREAYRAEHHERMRQRAEAMGLSIPEAIPPRGQRSGRGWRYPGGGAWGPGFEYPYYGGYGYPGFRGPGYPGGWGGYGCPGW